MNSIDKKELKKLQEKSEKIKIINDFTKKLMENQQDLPPEFSKIVDDNFFDLI